MTEKTYSRGKTALLFVDPYNDFLSEGGKVYPRIKPIADEVGLLDNLRRLDGAIRAAGIQVVIVPHRTAAGSPATMRPGTIPTLPSGRSCIATASHVANGAANGIRTLRRRLATSSPMSTGAKADSPTPI